MVVVLSGKTAIELVCDVFCVWTGAGQNGVCASRLDRWGCAVCRVVLAPHLL